MKKLPNSPLRPHEAELQSSVRRIHVLAEMTWLTSAFLAIWVSQFPWRELFVREPGRSSFLNPPLWFSCESCWVMSSEPFFSFFYAPARCLEPHNPRRGARHRGPEVQATTAGGPAQDLPLVPWEPTPRHGQADTAPTSAAGPGRGDQGLQFPHPPPRVDPFE